MSSPTICRRRPGIRRLLPTLALPAGLALASCTEAPAAPTDEPEPSDSAIVVQRGSRLLGVSISDRSDGDFNSAFQEARDAGMQTTGLSLAWDDLEIAPGVYEPTVDYLGIAAAYYPPRETSLLLSINPIDTNRRRVPSYLEGRSWDDPAVVEAFEGLLDWALAAAAPLDLVALSIGNEIDATLATAGEWAAYREFLRQVSAHARALRPGLRVGTKITVSGLRGAFAAEAATLVEDTGLVLTTYYPLGSDFRIEPPSTVPGVFDDVAARFPGRPILFAEIGAPSTDSCGSSTSAQADFVSEAFAAWDRHAEQVELLEFVWMHDIDAAALARYESYYGLSERCFLDYLATLGLQSADGTDKPAWTRLVYEAAARGW